LKAANTTPHSRGSWQWWMRKHGMAHRLLRSDDTHGQVARADAGARPGEEDEDEGGDQRDDQDRRERGFVGRVHGVQRPAGGARGHPGQTLVVLPELG
jgi:hypothetical protein